MFFLPLEKCSLVESSYSQRKDAFCSVYDKQLYLLSSKGSSVCYTYSDTGYSVVLGIDSHTCCRMLSSQTVTIFVINQVYRHRDLSTRAIVGIFHNPCKGNMEHAGIHVM